jgi:RNA polymerase sigma-70 factor (ECF subfamily)
VHEDSAADKAFDAFYRAEYGRLAGSLRLACGDRSTADELAQEAFVRVYLAWGRLEHPPTGWLYTSAFNLLRRRWRLSRRRPPDLPLAQEDSPDAVPSRLVLAAALARLPSDQRTAVVVRYVLGYSSEEAAAMLHRTPGALRALLHRAVTTLRSDAGLFAREGND